MGDVADSMRARERRTIRPDHLPDCTLAGLCYEELPHSGCSRTGNTYCIHCSTWCICDRLRKAEQRAIAATREPGRIRVLIEEAEQRVRDSNAKALDEILAESQKAYRAGREDAARDVAALRAEDYCYDHDCRMGRAAVAAARGEKP